MEKPICKMNLKEFLDFVNAQKQAPVIPVPPKPKLPEIRIIYRPEMDGEQLNQPEKAWSLH